jgi:hypothetical protein
MNSLVRFENKNISSHLLKTFYNAGILKFISRRIAEATLVTCMFVIKLGAPICRLQCLCVKAMLHPPGEKIPLFVDYACTQLLGPEMIGAPSKARNNPSTGKPGIVRMVRIVKLNLSRRD